jgi:choline dehydrogenase
MKDEGGRMKQMQRARARVGSSFILHPSSFERRSAFTLIEVMISIALVLALIIGVNQVFKVAADTVGAGQVGGAACTPHAIGGRPDVQFNVMPLSVDKPGDPLHRYSGFTAAVWQCHPGSRGRLAIRSTDPAVAPTIEPRYLDDPLDRRIIVAGIRMLRDIYAQPAFRDLFDVEMLPGPDAKSDDDLLAFARNGGGTVFHCVGTCRMGAAGDPTAVVDAKLRVRGVEALRVVDASVMPQVTSANTNAASLMIGEHGARLILEDAWASMGSEL